VQIIKFKTKGKNMLNQYLGLIIRRLIIANIGLQNDLLYMQGAMIELDNEHQTKVIESLSEQKELYKTLYELKLDNINLTKRIIELSEEEK
jgi:SNF2 family DNA or RNA helicase